MKFSGFLIISITVLAFSHALLPQQTTSANVSDKAKGVADYYKQKVKGIALKGQEEIVAGQIVAFQKNGILFKRTKEGPFYNPKPEFFPIQQIQAFVDDTGKPVWGELPVIKKYDYLKTRQYKLKLGIQYGLGQHPNSYTFTPLVSDADNYIQDLHSGSTAVGQAAYFLSPHYSVGCKYVHHNTKAEIYSLKSEAIGALYDDIVIQNFMFDVGFYQSVSRLVIFNADVAMGGLFYTNNRTSSTDAVKITGTSFSVLLGGGVDFLLTRNIAIGFDLSYLFGRIKDPTVSENSQVIEGTQSLNRFDITAGVKFYF